MEYIYASVLIIFMFLFWFSNFFNIPGNWLNIGILLLWKFIFSTMSWYFWFGLVAIAFFAEILEYFCQWWLSKKYGGTTKGNIGSFVGAIVGAIMGAPFFLGVGAIVGSILGAFSGSLVFELIGNRTVKDALVASKGAAIGKTLGFSLKAGFGMVIVVLSLSKIWP